MIPQTIIPVFVEGARCASVDPAVFFPGKADHSVPESQWAYPRRICEGCPVATACLTAAMDAEKDRAPGARFGMWGGMTPAQRAGLHAPAARRGRRPARCGTPSGYRRHRARGEETCQACRDAWAAYMRQRDAEKAAAEGRRVEVRKDRAARERAAGAAHLLAFERAVLAGEPPQQATRHAGHRTLRAVAALARRHDRPDIARIADRYRRIQAQEES